MRIKGFKTWMKLDLVFGLMKYKIKVDKAFKQIIAKKVKYKERHNRYIQAMEEVKLEYPLK